MRQEAAVPPASAAARMRGSSYVGSSSVDGGVRGVYATENPTVGLQTNETGRLVGGPFLSLLPDYGVTVIVPFMFIAMCGVQWNGYLPAGMPANEISYASPAFERSGPCNSAIWFSMLAES